MKNHIPAFPIYLFETWAVRYYCNGNILISFRIRRFCLTTEEIMIYEKNAIYILKPLHFTSGSESLELYVN